jgi:3'(2'), 5'-bisphosphate nucleotidase
MLENLQLAIGAAYKAGLEIIDVYSSSFEVELKSDKTPLTEADKRAHNTIATELKGSEYPILSEEGRDIPYTERKNWSTFWMVDPLDGTKEFIKRNGEFTVNIALIEDQKPVMGVIYVPVTQTLYFGLEGKGAFKIAKFNGALGNVEDWIADARELPIREAERPFTAVGSRSHPSQETTDFLNKLTKKHGQLNLVSMGSSLKICLVAEGAADIYPRFAPTMEWDTAAGHGIALAAGKDIIDHNTGKRMKYNKENLLNNWFIVR